MESVTLHRGRLPLLISLPHDGTDVPDDIAETMTESSLRVPDTDWFVSRLYEVAREMGASMLYPRYSRYVVDLNRPPDDVSLYPGQNTTGLCPIVQFSGEPVYRDGRLPSPQDVGARVERYWRPYHSALASEIARLHAKHGRVLLWEGHSIRSVVAFLFEGCLPDFNLGTVGGSSCNAVVQSRVLAVLEAQSTASWVANGRFKGGYITRKYGDPARSINAIQLELAQTTYMDEATVRYDEARARPTQALIVRLLEAALASTAR